MSKRRRSRYGWTRDAWLAYKRQAIIIIEMILHWAANSRAVEAMMERGD